MHSSFMITIFFAISFQESDLNIVLKVTETQSSTVSTSNLAHVYNCFVNNNRQSNILSDCISSSKNITLIRNLLPSFLNQSTKNIKCQWTQSTNYKNRLISNPILRNNCQLTFNEIVHIKQYSLDIQVIK